MVISHAAGLSGTPAAGHCSSAATSASCARSSASATSRVICVRAPTRRAESARHVAMIASVRSSEGDCAGTRPAYEVPSGAGLLRAGGDLAQGRDHGDLGPVLRVQLGEFLLIRHGL